MLTLDGAPVKVADPKTRESCLHGYTFLLEPVYMVIFETLTYLNMLFPML